MITIRPDKHGVIEASAGTGKTYTLVELVKQLLTTENVALEQILLVTFTDKAAGELKERLRAALQEMLRGDAAMRPLIQPALDSFDQAHVYTIHGFCQRVLQEYAFENRHDFRPQMADDGALLATCLRELQRTQWRKDHGQRMASLLALSGYGASWEELVTDLALRYRSGCGHKIVPAPLENLAATLEDVEGKLRDALAAARKLAGILVVTTIEEHRWHQGFGQLPFNPTYLNARRRDVLVPMLRWLLDPMSDTQGLGAFCRLLQACLESGAFGSTGFRCLSDGLSKNAQSQLDELCPKLREAVEGLEEMRAIWCGHDLEVQLAGRTIVDLQARLAEHKSERGLLSFEDMLTRVADAVDPAKGPRGAALLALLRDRYRFAIVDEFQDTDPIQWSIFKQIFVAGAGRNRLFVVGDPKQAIFGFRGADVAAYHAAGTELRDLHGAAAHALTANWRSCPDLIGALNQVFDKGKWFADTGLTFTDATCPAEEIRPYRIATDRTGRAAFTVVHLKNVATLVRARHWMAGFIAEEIQRLLSHAAPALEFEKKGQPGKKALDAGDICVLVARRPEAGPILDSLARAHIPYTFYKKAGLWQSSEASHLAYVLRAIADPEDSEAFAKALMTCFVRIRAEDMARCEEVPQGHPVKQLFQAWCGLAVKRCWGALFQSLLDDTGLFFYEADAPDFERRLANFRQIFQTLEHSAYAQDLDVVGVLDLLEERRRHGDPDADVQPIETDRPKVKIMTIHAAKGLEFPVVFLAGGFTYGPAATFLTYRDKDGRQVFDLRAGKAPAEVKAGADAEKDREHRRLYYVALTRAMFKLYVPYPTTDAGKYKAPGPVISILAPAIAESGIMKRGRPCADEVVVASVPRPIPLPPAAGSTAASDDKKKVGVPLDVLFPDIDPRTHQRRIRIRSFSSLHRQAALAAPPAPSYIEPPPRDDDDAPNVLQGPEPIRGPVFGEMVHDILEAIDFEKVGAAVRPESLATEVIDLIEDKRKLHWSKLPVRLSADPERVEACRLELARLVWTALHTPLQAAGGPLWKIPASDRIHELEFHYPEVLDKAPAEVNREEGFLTGFMDLVFRKDGKYFLVDWKTNSLPGSYARAAVARSMEECGYNLQYRLYLHALARWLGRAHGPSFDFRRDFGGVYYLYVRGMNAKDESAGVFFYRPGPDDMNPRALGGV